MYEVNHLEIILKLKNRKLLQEILQENEETMQENEETMDYQEKTNKTET